MASLNKAQLIGYLGNDPDVQTLSNGESVARFSMATTERWKDKVTGEDKEHTEWHNVSFFGKRADVIKKYLKKGSLVFVEGSLKTRKYMDKDNIEKYSTSIKGTTLEMLDRKTDSSEKDYGTNKPKASPPIEDDDIPF
jgi:single-strand DNA-binding protein